jgi:hypothetical protein
MLALGLAGGALGLGMLLPNLKEGGGAVVVSIIFLVLLGIIPLWIFVQRRKFLAIASDKEVICFPMDRKKKEVRRAIELMKKYCPGNQVRWEVGET